MSDDLLGLETRELLKKFGAGDHKPGSGSAAGLLGLIGVKLCQTVISLTRDRPQYAEGGNIITARESELSTIEESLERYVQEDSRLFDEVIRLRRMRDELPEGTERRRVRDQLARATWAATDLPLEMIDELILLGDIAIQVFQLGFQSARGDSAVAVRAAHAAANGSLSIVHLNLQSTREPARTRSALDRADEQQARLRVQEAVFERLREDLRDEAREKVAAESVKVRSDELSEQEPPSGAIKPKNEFSEPLTFD